MNAARVSKRSLSGESFAWRLRKLVLNGHFAVNNCRHCIHYRNKEPLSNSHDGYSDDEESVTTYHRMPPKGSPAGGSINQADDDTL